MFDSSGNNKFWDKTYNAGQSMMGKCVVSHAQGEIDQITTVQIVKAVVTEDGATQTTPIFRTNKLDEDYKTYKSPTGQERYKAGNYNLGLSGVETTMEYSITGTCI